MVDSAERQKGPRLAVSRLASTAQRKHGQALQHNLVPSCVTSTVYRRYSPASMYPMAKPLSELGSMSTPSSGRNSCGHGGCHENSQKIQTISQIHRKQKKNDFLGNGVRQQRQVKRRPTKATDKGKARMPQNDACIGEIDRFFSSNMVCEHEREPHLRGH